MSNQKSGRQSFALFSAIAAYAHHLDDLENLMAMVERIAHKHTSMNIKPEHYDIVGHHLIETLRELATEQFTAEIEAAWVAAYQQLAGVFINKEAGLYEERGNAAGGWKDGRAFVLVEKRIESELVKSLVFEPVDGKPVIGYQSGQYIGIEVDPNKGIQSTTDEEAYREIRQYSLSDKPNGETYCISVKREILGKPGVVSNYLHDGLRLGEEVTLYAPAGDFHLKSTNSPVVLVSAGVEDQLPLALADFYLCGPVAFMQFAKQQLVRLGVNTDRIHYEVFGPHESF